MLDRASLRKTGARMAILQYLQQSRGAQALSDLEKALGSKADRATLYRSLITFESKGLVHKVVDPDGVVRFALCEQECSGASHSHAHVHFSCIKCGQLLCLPDTHLPVVSLPEGFVPEGVQLVYYGRCNQCQAD